MNESNEKPSAKAPPAKPAAAAAAPKTPPEVAAQVRSMAQKNKDPAVAAVRSELKRQGDMARNRHKAGKEQDLRRFQRTEYDANGAAVDKKQA